MKKILIALLALTMCLSFFACGGKTNNATSSEAQTMFSLEELVNDPEFQEAFNENENDMFTYSVSASSDSVLVYEAHCKKTYDDAEFLRNLTLEEISDKFDLAGLQKLLKRYGFGKITIDVKIYNGDGELLNEKTLAA